eukprot:Nitzschia sp. Nitz4//scaffold26_size159584//111716//113050//NITZ4_002505-RA/size159584-snap-gene-0.46-mRNA-1//-1//CDS//3329545124//2958//frame0
MGRRLRKFLEKRRERREKLKNSDTKQRLLDAFGDDKPKVLTTDIMMISGCEDSQTSADVSNVANFQLPDPTGRAGGACTSTLLNILYKDEQQVEKDLSFVEVLGAMRDMLSKKGYSQIPQLTSTKELDLTHKFDLVPDDFSGTARALMIGINYVGHSPGELSGCHNDVGNMKKYIMDVHGFQEENITVLMDDGNHKSPTKDNMIAAYKKIVADSQPGDSIFLHYSGHGSKLRDDDFGEEEDGYDEVLVPLDYNESGMIRDDTLYEILVKGLPDGIHVVSLMDCCHSGTILDLPFKFQPTGEFEGMQLDEDFDWKPFGGLILNVLSDIFASF